MKNQTRLIVNLKGLVDEPLDGDITDVEYTTDDRMTDDDILQYLRKLLTYRAPYRPPKERKD